MSYFTMLVRGLLFSFAITCGAVAHAQAFGESEPNNTCIGAQPIGPISLPSSVVGSLDSTSDVPDVDFFLFEGVAGESIQVDLEGATSGAGTLSDPFLGLFNSDCALLALNDDGGGGLNSRLSFVVPDNAMFVLAVTNCCDSGFFGGGVGSYLLTLTESQSIDSISGRIVNAVTGAPLSGMDFPYASAQLWRCGNDGCFEFVSHQQVDSDGNFLFANDQFGNLLSVGTYQIQASASGFEFSAGNPFFVSEGEASNVGDIGLAPLQLIGLVTGRLVDGFSGNPLAGNVPPFPFVTLQRCEDFGCFDVAGAVPDEFGRFSINGAANFISPGTFQLFGRAEDYRESTSAQFTVAAFEDIDIGDFAMTPFPIQFGAIQPCEIPPGGGACEYGIEITYTGAERRYRGKAWSIVEYYAPPSFRLTRFQVGKGGAEHPRPENVMLRRGETSVASFHLDVPPSVPDGATVCGYITVGQVPEPQFNSQSDRFIFCSVKQPGGLTAMSEKEGRQRLSELKNRDRSLDKRSDRSQGERRPR